MDDFSAVTALLVWLSPVLLPLLVVGLLVVVMPLAVGVVVAVAVLVVRAVRGQARQDVTVRGDPWARLAALAEPDDDVEDLGPSTADSGAPT